MAIRCKFCGNQIRATHYFISKQGSICPECQKHIKDELKSFGVYKEGKDDKASNRTITAGKS